MLSFNCRGLASPRKKLALRRLIALEAVNILFLQETLGPTSTITPSLESWLPGWSFYSLDSMGRSGGLALRTYNHSIKLNNIWGGHRYLGADIFSPTLEADYKIINVYDPCHDRADYWRKLLNSTIL